VDNWSMRTARRAEWKLELDLQNDSAAIKSFMEELSAEIQTNKQIKQHQLWMADILKNQLLLQLECLTEPLPVEAFQQIKQEVNWSIKTLLEKHALKTISEESKKN
jgi:hypothetical protein